MCLLLILDSTGSVTVRTCVPVRACMHIHPLVHWAVTLCLGNLGNPSSPSGKLGREPLPLPTPTGAWGIWAGETIHKCQGTGSSSWGTVQFMAVTYIPLTDWLPFPLSQVAPTSGSGHQPTDATGNVFTRGGSLRQDWSCQAPPGREFIHPLVFVWFCVSPLSGNWGLRSQMPYFTSAGFV